MTAEARRVKGQYWDRAWYLVEGCTPVDASCRHCWAAAFAHRFSRQEAFLTNGGEWNGKVELAQSKVDIPGNAKKGLTWAVWNDLGHEKLDRETLRFFLAMMECMERHTFIVLTKRIRGSLAKIRQSERRELPKNVWFGTSISGTSEVESFYRLKALCESSWLRGKKIVSAEPLLSGVSFMSLGEKAKEIDLLIVGCESGQYRRRVPNEYLESVIENCEKYEIPLFIKQWDFSGKEILKPKDFPQEYQKYTELPF